MTFDPRVQVSIDTERANERTFKRRDFMRPPRENYEENAGQERNQASFSQPTISDDHFIDEIPEGNPDIADNGLPVGNAGDILYHDGDEWVTLSAPSSGAVLRHNGTAPFWEQPSDVCS